MNACTVDTAAREIKVAGGFTADVAEGDSIEISVGPITNPNWQYSESFTILSYTDDTLEYKVDKVPSGLIP